MNVNQTDLLFQMMQMANQFAQSTLPAVGTGSETGKSDFQSLLEDKRAESGQTPERPAKEEDAPAKPEDGQTQKPEDGQTAEQPQGQEPAVEAWKLGLLAYAGQLNIQPEVTAEVPVEGQAAHLVAAVPEGEAAQAAPVAQAATEQAAAVPVQTEQAAQTAMPVQADEAQAGQPQTVETRIPEAAETVQPETAVRQAPEASAGRDARPQGGTEEQPAPGEDGRPQAELQVDGWQQPLFREVEHMPVKVGDTTALDTTAPQFDNQLADTLDTALADGVQRLELKLTPENLGTVVVEMTRNPDGALHIVLRAETEQAARLLNDHSHSLGMLLQNSAQGEVRVEVPQPQQSEQQPWKQPDQNGGQQQGGEGQPQRQHREERSTDDFLSQLRLGLLETAAE